jgi:hypothetical protein
LNFKGVQTFLEKSNNFSKIPSSHDLHKSEFSWVHLCTISSYKTRVQQPGLNKRKEFEFEIQTLQYLIKKTNLQEFHSSF